MLDYCSEEDRSELINSLGQPQMLLELLGSIFFFEIKWRNRGIFVFCSSIFGQFPEVAYCILAASMWGIFLE